MLQVIDPTQYADAARALSQANSDTADIAGALFAAIGDAGLSAGRGDGTRCWCAAYERAAGQITKQLSHLIRALGNAATLLDTSGHNHGRAEAAAAPYGLPVYAMTRTQRDMASIDTVSMTGIPTMYGGNSDEPLGWGLISSHLLSPWWPGADLARIDRLAAAWKDAAAGLRTTTYRPDVAVAELETLASPELSDAMDVCRRLSQACDLLADDCESISTACTDFASEVSKQRDQVNRLVKEFFAAAGITELLALGASLLSAGISELVSKAVDSGLMGIYAGRISAVLDTLSEALQRSDFVLAVSDASDDRLSGWLTKVATAQPVLAVIDAEESNLAGAAHVELPAGAGAASERPPRYSVTSEDMEHWEHTTKSHTIRKHVGKTREELMERLAKEHHHGRVSTFGDLAEAVSAINTALASKTEEIDHWIAGPDDSKKLGSRLKPNIGIVVDRTGASTAGGTVFVILRKDSRQERGWRVHTAYLER